MIPSPPRCPSPDASEAAIELIMGELSNARLLEVSSKLHGQTVAERIDHLTGLLEWFAEDNDETAADFDLVPRIDTTFTMVALRVLQPSLGPGLPEMMAGIIIAYTKATVPGSITHLTKWDYGLYTDEFTVPEHLAFENLDGIPGDELMTEIGCFYMPNESGMPNESVDYWAYAETQHLYVTVEPYHYEERQLTEDLEDTRNPTSDPSYIGPPCGGYY